jgi:hypothetical protein
MSLPVNNFATFRFHFLWMPKELGGHTDGPWEGMRTNIRWQKHVEEYLTDTRGTSLSGIEYNPSTLQGTASATLIAQVPEAWLQEGELIELLGSYNVLAVGKIIR